MRGLWLRRLPRLPGRVRVGRPRPLALHALPAECRAAGVDVDEEGVVSTPAYLADLAREITTESLLRDTLAAGVPLAMADLERQGGPLERDYAEARAFGETIATEGADILFRSRKRGVTAALVTRLIRALAVLAYVPGGVTVAGLHFDAGRPDADGKVCCRSMGVEMRKRESYE